MFRSLSVAYYVGLIISIYVNNGSNADETVQPSAQKDLPPGELGQLVALGKEIVENTGKHPLSKPFVGNALTCNSCHLNAGTDPRAAMFLSVATAYPAWSPREKRVITLEDRVLNCFMRSLNGIRPPSGSKVSVAVTTYITWLSRDEQLKMNPNAPLGPKHVLPLDIDVTKADVGRAGLLYADHCASCHWRVQFRAVNEWLERWTDLRAAPDMALQARLSVRPADLEAARNRLMLAASMQPEADESTFSPVAQNILSG